MQRIARYLLGKNEGSKFGYPDKLIRFNLRVMEDSIVLDQVRFADGIVVESMESTDKRGLHTLLDPGVDLTARQDNK